METLVSIGAVEFLSHLRHDVDPSVYQYIDNVLTNLLSLPDIVESDDEQLHYDKGKQTNDLDRDVRCDNTDVNAGSVDVDDTKEEHPVPMQKSVDEIQILTGQQEWHGSEGIFNIP